MTNTVCTFFELTEGEDTVAQPFYGLERELLLKSLRTLEKQHKAEIFEKLAWYSVASAMAALRMYLQLNSAVDVAHFSHLKKTSPVLTCVVIIFV